MMTTLTATTAQQAPLDVVTLGEAMAMFVAAQTGDLAEVETFTKRIAGAELNVAIGLTRLGMNVGWVSRVGNDSFGRFTLQQLKRRHQLPAGDGRRPLSHRLSGEIQNRRWYRSQRGILPQRLGGQPPVGRRFQP